MTTTTTLDDNDITTSSHATTEKDSGAGGNNMMMDSTTETTATTSSSIITDNEEEEGGEENETTTTTATTTTECNKNKNEQEETNNAIDNDLDLGDKKTMMLPLLSNEVILEILNTKAPYKDETQKDICKRLVEELSKEDQEVAACSSYAYWVLSNTTRNDDDEEKKVVDMDEMRIRMAMKEARRHLVGEDEKYDKGLEALKESIHFRKEHRINDIIRTCMPNNQNAELNIKNDNDDEKNQLLRNEYCELILDDLQKQIMVVRGYDKTKYRPVLYKMARTVPTEESKPNAFFITQLYVAERAMACAEYISRGQLEEKIMTVFDFDNYYTSNRPPRDQMVLSTKVIQRVYPERLQTFLILEPPFWIKTLWFVLKYLISKDTQNKLEFIYGSKKEEKLREFLDIDQAMPFLMKDGKLTSPIDVHHYANHVPFHCLYDDIPLPE